MASPIKSKEIQVQKPAQSLQAFQAKLETGKGSDLSFLKPVLIGVSLLLVGSFGFFAFRSWRAGAVKKHEMAVADLVLAVQGDPRTPSQPADIEKRMRENLPKLEALAKTAPASQRETTQGLVATWRLNLEGKGGIEAQATDPWSRLKLAQRQIALGQGPEALTTLNPLKTAAVPSEAWGDLFWKTLLDAHALRGDREQALKDYAEYKLRFRDRADVRGMERILIGI